MKLLILAITIYFYQVITEHRYYDGFGFDRTTICTTPDSAIIKGKYKITTTKEGYSVLIKQYGQTKKIYYLTNKLKN